MFSMALMAKGNESYINIGAVKLREMNPNASLRETRLSETSPNKYWKNQAEGSNYKPRSKFIWVQKAKRNEFEYICAVRLSKTSPNKVRRDQPKGS